MHASMLSRFSRIWLYVTLWTLAHQAPLSMGSSRKEYWSGLPCPPPGDLLDPGIKPVSLTSPALADEFLTISITWEAPQVILSPTFSHSQKPHGRAPGAMILSQSQTPVWASGREFSSSAWVWVARVTHPESPTRIWAYVLHVYSRHTQRWEERLMPSGICKVKLGSQLLHN